MTISVKGLGGESHIKSFSFEAYVLYLSNIKVISYCFHQWEHFRCHCMVLVFIFFHEALPTLLLSPPPPLNGITCTTQIGWFFWEPSECPQVVCQHKSCLPSRKVSFPFLKALLLIFSPSSDQTGTIWTQIANRCYKLWWRWGNDISFAQIATAECSCNFSGERIQQNYEL